MSRRALIIQSLYDRQIEAEGNTYVIKETGETFKALADFLAQTDFPLIDAEGPATNTEELNPLMLYALDRASALQPIQNIHLQSAADEDAENLLVETVDSDMIGDVEVRRYALVYRSPIRK